VNSEGLAAWRMRNLGLFGSSFERPDDVVRWLVAVQSQDYGPAKWSVADRVDGVNDAAMDQAVSDGSILRTHVLRPTWHFVVPADIRWLLALTAPRIRTLNARYYRELGLDETVLEKSARVLADALRGGNQLVRKELAAVLEQAGVAADGMRLGYILMDAELAAAICSGALRGKQQTYALLAERAPDARVLSDAAALAELTLRYFTSHGPATAKDYRWWSSLTAAQITTGLEMVAPQLEHADIDGRRYWFAEPTAGPKPPAPTVHLLQGYDEYLVGYSESRHILDVSGVARSFTAGNVLFNQVVVLDDQVVGQWKQTLTSGSVVIEVVLYIPFDHAQTRALEAAADRYGEFLGRSATVIWPD
jgi:hypothetical protein